MCGCKGGARAQSVARSHGIRKLGNEPPVMRARVIQSYSGLPVGRVVRVDRWEFAQLKALNLVEEFHDNPEALRATDGT